MPSRRVLRAPMVFPTMVEKHLNNNVKGFYTPSKPPGYYIVLFMKPPPEDTFKAKFHFSYVLMLLF